MWSGQSFVRLPPVLHRRGVLPGTLKGAFGREETTPTHCSRPNTAKGSLSCGVGLNRRGGKTHPRALGFGYTSSATVVRTGQTLTTHPHALARLHHHLAR